MSKTLIGRNVDDNTEVEIGDSERRSGLYILGNPGMGKVRHWWRIHFRR